MSLRTSIARKAAAVSRFALRNLLHRDGMNFPGKLGLAIDPELIRHLASNLQCGSICVVGTNGKTTVTNLIADILQRSGYSVCCNRSGANLAYGAASALLEQGGAQWGVIECDELWLPKVLPQLSSRYVVLLNLFRDQLDRAGEIEIVQQRIVAALSQSPDTTLVYNADDPLCHWIAQSVCNPSIPFGIGESMGLSQNTVSDSHICQQCSSPLEYDFHQYGQLGSYHCSSCEFKKPPLDYTASKIRLSENQVSFKLEGPELGHAFSADMPGAYMVYNLMAAAVAASQAGCDSPAAIQQAINAFHPNNGRLEQLSICSHSVLINLAKNPTGMNQSLRIALANSMPFVLGIFINDKEADGHDVSWLWDADFQELAARPDVQVFAGGIRKRDMQVRLKYAGIPAGLAESAEELMAFANAFDPKCPVYLIANYTALPAVRSQAEAMAASSSPIAARSFTAPKLPSTAQETQLQEPLVIGHLLPELLNLYGDGGNVTVLQQRLAWRGIPVEVRTMGDPDSLDLSDVDLLFIGGAPDREQEIASHVVMGHSKALRDFITHGGPCLAICGGFQMLGASWLLNNRQTPGLGIGDFETRRAGSARNRLVDDIALSVDGIAHLVIGYENHAGRTFLSPADKPFGRVVSKSGHGNNDSDGFDGFAQENLIATYLHGPLLAKNPEVADKLLSQALDHWSCRTGQDRISLEPLDDAEELAANAFMAARLL